MRKLPYIFAVSMIAIMSADVVRAADSNPIASIKYVDGAVADKLSGKEDIENKVQTNAELDTTPALKTSTEHYPSMAVAELKANMLKSDDDLTNVADNDDKYTSAGAANAIAVNAANVMLIGLNSDNKVEGGIIRNIKETRGKITDIQTSLVETTDIKDGAVTTAKIADKNVTAAKLDSALADKIAKIDGKQDKLGFTPENVTNKTQTIAAANSASETKYPSEKAVADALATKAGSGDIKDATLTIKQNGVVKGTFTANQGTAETIELADTQVTVDSELDDKSINPVQNKVVKGALDGKQPKLTAGKFINIDATNTITTTYKAGTNVQIAADGTISATDTNTTYGTGNSTVPGVTKLYAVTGQNIDGAMTQKAVTDALGGKQDSLTAGDYIEITKDAKTGATVISSTGPTYTLPAASAELGGVKSGGDITVDAAGVVTVNNATNDGNGLNIAENYQKKTGYFMEQWGSAVLGQDEPQKHLYPSVYATRQLASYEVAGQIKDLKDGKLPLVTGFDYEENSPGIRTIKVLRGNATVPVGSATAGSDSQATIWIE